MRMKNDHMQNGQLKASYNVQGSSNNQFIVNYTLEQPPNDTSILKSLLQEHIDSFNQVPDTLTSDAGYGSKENYQELENQDIEDIFENIKQNMNIKRFMLRGIYIVETGFGLMAMAHNLKKMSLAS